jgi:hypothetical protein
MLPAECSPCLLKGLIQQGPCTMQQQSLVGSGLLCTTVVPHNNRRGGGADLGMAFRAIHNIPYLAACCTACAGEHMLVGRGWMVGCGGGWETCLLSRRIRHYVAAVYRLSASTTNSSSDGMLSGHW